MVRINELNVKNEGENKKKKKETSKINNSNCQHCQTPLTTPSSLFFVYLSGKRKLIFFFFFFLRMHIFSKRSMFSIANKLSRRVLLAAVVPFHWLARQALRGLDWRNIFLDCTSSHDYRCERCVGGPSTCMRLIFCTPHPLETRQRWCTYRPAAAEGPMWQRIVNCWCAACAELTTPAPVCGVQGWISSGNEARRDRLSAPSDEVPTFPAVVSHLHY